MLGSFIGSAIGSVPGGTALVNSVIDAEAASFSLTAKAVNLRHASRVAAQPAAMTLSPQTITMFRSILPQAASFNFLGKDLEFNIGLPASTANFIFSAQDTNFKLSMQVVKAVFTLTGQDTTFNIYMPVAKASFTLTGKAIAVFKGYVLQAEVASFVLSPATVSISIASALVWSSGVGKVVSWEDGNVIEDSWINSSPLNTVWTEDEGL